MTLDNYDISEDLKNWISSSDYFGFSQSHLLLKTDVAFNIKHLVSNDHAMIVNLKRINDLHFINAFLETVNHSIKEEQSYTLCLETSQQRRQRLLDKFPFLFNHLYYSFDFIFKRFLSKVPIGKQLTFFLTANRNRVISKVEIIGRICYAGFSIVRMQEIEGLLYIEFSKEKGVKDLDEKTYGPLIKLPRVGYKGKTIGVYKLRTMHSYSEHIQSLIYSENDLEKGGKLKNDYRISPLGKILRKFWIDETPMLLNFLKGDMKLIGGRPLSNHYFGLYEKSLQERRKNYKPGLLPPFYADMPETIEEIQASEVKYFDLYDRIGWRADIVYFFKIFNTIVFKGKRSA